MVEQWPTGGTDISQYKYKIPPLVSRLGNKLWLRRGTLNPGPGGIGMTKLKSTLLFGVAIHLNMKMGAKSPGWV